MGLSYHIYRHYFPEVLAKVSILRMPSTSGIILMYHEVLPDDISLPAWTVLQESNFHCQMSYLRMHFDVIGIDHCLERVRGKHAAKRPFAMVTFDDGYRGNFSTVLPIMESMGLPFTVYVATKAIVEKELHWYDRIINLLNMREDVQVELTWDNQPEYFIIPRCGEERRWKEVQKILTRMKLMEPVEREKVARNIAGNFSGTKSPLAMLSEDELRCLANSTCVTIGCHTHGHEILDQLEDQEIIDTLRVASEHLTRITGYPPHHFSYPNGNFNESILDHVRKAGFETAVTTMPGIWSHEDDRLKIPRIGIGRFDTMGSFKARLSRYL